MTGTSIAIRHRSSRRWLAGCGSTALLAGVLFLHSPAVSAVTQILYEAEDRPDVVSGEDLWRYTYRVSGYAFEFDQSFFWILFPPDRYDEITRGTVPAGWDADILLPDENFPDAIFYGTGDSSAADELTFSVDFRWFGTGAPGEQAFAVYLGSDLVHEGLTSTTPIPEPSTLALLGTALALLALVRVRRRFERGSACRR
jgi:hypothetical protein